MSATHSILRRSTATAENPPFVPSPQWLSESPARPPSSRGTPASARIEHLAQNTPRVRPQSSPSQPSRGPVYLRSPVPPPPANLFTAGSTGLNVDPGLPFHANAGSIDAGSDKGSVDDAPRQGKLAGSIVGGLKRAVGSLRRGTLSSRSHSTGMGPSPPAAALRDSGYGHSTPQLVGPATFPAGTGAEQYYPPTHVETVNGHVNPSSIRSPVSQNAYTPAQIMSPPQLFSPVSAAPEFGSDYAQMDPPTPPPSDVSFNTYLTRAQRIANKIASLPWVAPERPTVDYYPERSRRRDELKRAPQISWRAPDFARPNFKVATGGGLAEEGSDAGTWDSYEEFQREGDEGKVPIIAIIPHRGSQVDLGEEFGEAPPLPANPPVFTPRFKEQGIYTGNTPAVSMKLPLSQMATPEPLPPPLPQDPPIYPPMPQDPPIYPPLPQDPPDQPIMQPQPRYSSDNTFQPSSGPGVVSQATSRASSRGYALYDPPVTSQFDASPTSARSSQRILLPVSEHQRTPAPPRPPSMRSTTAPSHQSAHTPSHQSASPRTPERRYTQPPASLRATPRSSRGSVRGPLIGDGEWEQYPVGRTGYIPYDEAHAQGYYAHGTRSGSNSPSTTVPPRASSSARNSPRSFPFQ
ncbi:hypothetical protein HYPSUDRAFT_1097610 [Hypholoma sublateritium FD-334 SS-4]|uniref:Uncharacterized protein n=1 Tax=Hypholoma sublateritium (strain FD-334 SS-4) TaxID=945553 RepID=A0A0D2KVL0_HYPSF|nr:hypothetical protein HYPSUDRAFT_1097610 [Hypholoma sublateritium FD-334 SS-4]